MMITRAGAVAVVSLALTILFSPTPTFAQRTIVPDEPSCPNCTIQLSIVAKLGPEGDVPTSPSAVVVDSRDRYWLTFDNEPAIIYDKSGRLVTTLRRGQGPGEFQYPWLVLPVGDSILVQDRSRGFVLLGPDLREVRAAPSTTVMGPILVISWPDSVLLNSRRYDRREDMNPFHILSLRGNQPIFARSFGAERAAPADPQEMVSMRRVFTTASGSDLWVLEPREYELQLRSREGQLKRSLVREPSWFPRGPKQMNFQEPPPPMVAAVEQASDGMVWVYSRVAAPTWKDGYPKMGPGTREVSSSAFAMDKLYRAVVEVIDPSTARVVTRHNIDAHLVSPLPGQRIALYKTTADGEPYIEIMKMTLQR